MKRILFLGFGRSETRLIDALIDAQCDVDHTREKVCDLVGYDLIVSFGYRHILCKELINSAACPILNNHISYLPFNRGAHPNFWSFYENTPAGVSIHLMDEGIDTGPIVYQKKVFFDSTEITFEQTYIRLISEIERLFIDNIDEILTGDWTSSPQTGEGTLHFMKDLPQQFNGWQSTIEYEVKRLKELSGADSLDKKI